MLLGINHPVIKAHGNSKADGFCSAIRVASEFAASGAIGQIEEVMAKKKGEDAAE